MDFGVDSVFSRSFKVRPIDRLIPMWYYILSLANNGDRVITTQVRIYIEDVPDLTQIRLILSLKQRRDVTTAEVIRWLLEQPEAKRMIEQDAAARRPTVIQGDATKGEP